MKLNYNSNYAQSTSEQNSHEMVKIALVFPESGE